MNLPLQFNPIPYPLWRRAGLKRLRPLLNGLTTAEADGLHGGAAPASPAHMAHYLLSHGILPAGMNVSDTRDALAALSALPVERAERDAPPPAPEVPVRYPAQWEPMEAIIVAFPVLYPALWETHAQIIEAVSAVARADVLLPDVHWAGAVWLFLQARALADLSRVRLLLLPTDDIWVRDYGPFHGYTAYGERVLLGATYDPLPSYPQAEDDRMPRRYATHDEIPLRPFALHTEGGNFWSDGRGTLIASEGLYDRNRHLGRQEVERQLARTFSFDKLFVTPSLWREETGHVDLLVKLADANTILITDAALPFNGGRLKQARRIFERETNAAGERYRIFTLPAPMPFLNWGVFPVWRTYTNSLTVNGRVLVPVFGLPSDDHALGVYRAAMPNHTIIPIWCREASNGGGAVHCLTKEIPA
jgi:agmatine deiminase